MAPFGTLSGTGYASGSTGRVADAEIEPGRATMAERIFSLLVIDQYAWHAPILDPLADLLSARHDVERISMAAFEAGERAAGRRTDLIVVADAGTAVALRWSLPDATILHVGHGLISKNGPALSYHAADYVCVASAAIAERLVAQGHVPRRAYLPTGLIQSDPLFRDTPRGQGVRVPGCAVSVVYAPTWTPLLTSADMLGADLVGLIRGDDSGIGIVIKPHPHIAVSAPHLIDLWRGAAERHENVVLHPPDADLVPVLLGADLMISDASSAVFHYLALNRPIVLIDNPERFSSPLSYDAEGIEWQWRDIGWRIERVEDLRSAVAGSLAEPNRHETARLARRAALFGDLADGRARGRVAAAVDRILDEAKAV